MGELAAFIILALVTLVPAAVVVTSRNLVRAALSLVPTFLGVTGLYILLHAEFVAGIQILIYAGAITVLILFVIMLTEGGTGVRVRQITEQVPLGAMAAVWLAFVVLTILLRTPWPGAAGAAPQYGVASVGTALLTDYVLVFEVTSLVLLVSLIGAIVIARREE
ncbi:MAG: NADH-quinone oxidoreductase subunit J [Armatimonadota bacterium]|nr:NADH-quinone oxidoreductase subunit J [Armatimonadota bacterium]MDR7401856.1 NADH-quinone oxidoreductase subunit J [Armatimonadota bacterium]MDR7403914.1 NADH-quinone oxidoreductase subunit J [Armatimonadota bacterium]MDR7437428.1 NADH-quinone oxidoreductase subunit J [Armatimonadota bacterium]MDR7473179.1 NADH-quinone oxidoreductase subunit J [Armatimonadota bacterium]